MILDSIYFGDFEVFLSENGLLDRFGITSSLGWFVSASPLRPCILSPNGIINTAHEVPVEQSCSCRFDNQCFYFIFSRSKLFSTSKNPKKPTCKSTNFQISYFRNCIFRKFSENFQKIQKMKKSIKKVAIWIAIKKHWCVRSTTSWLRDPKCLLNLCQQDGPSNASRVLPDAGAIPHRGC